MDPATTLELPSNSVGLYVDVFHDAVAVSAAFFLPTTLAYACWLFTKRRPASDAFDFSGWMFLEYVFSVTMALICVYAIREMCEVRPLLPPMLVRAATVLMTGLALVAALSRIVNALLAPSPSGGGGAAASATPGACGKDVET